MVSSCWFLELLLCWTVTWLPLHSSSPCHPWIGTSWCPVVQYTLQRTSCFDYSSFFTHWWSSWVYCSFVSPCLMAWLTLTSMFLFKSSGMLHTQYALSLRLSFSWWRERKFWKSCSDWTHFSPDKIIKICTPSLYLPLWANLSLWLSPTGLTWYLTFGLITQKQEWFLTNTICGSGAPSMIELLSLSQSI